MCRSRAGDGKFGAAVRGDGEAGGDRERGGRGGRWRRFYGLVLLLAGVAVWQTTSAWAGAGDIEEVKSFATKLTSYVTAVAASVAVLFMAINGIRWTMSSGNPMRQTEARGGLMAAAAGLAIALSAGLLVNLVIAALK